MGDCHGRPLVRETATQITERFNNENDQQQTYPHKSLVRTRESKIHSLPQSSNQPQKVHIIHEQDIHVQQLSQDEQFAEINIQIKNNDQPSNPPKEQTANEKEEKPSQGLIKDLLKIDYQEQMEYRVYKHVGLLTFQAKSNSKLIKRSGIMISPNLVLTSASNIIDSNGNLYFNFRFYPGQCGEFNTNNEYKVEDHYVPNQYKQYRNIENNYALLKLEKKVKNMDFFSIGFVKQYEEAYSSFMIVGYPQCFGSDNDAFIGQVLKETENTKLEKNRHKNQIFCGIPSAPGLEGAPVLAFLDNYISVIGIHCGSVKNSEWCIIRPITFQLVNDLLGQAQSLQANLFMPTKPYSNYQFLQNLALKKPKDAQMLLDLGQMYAYDRQQYAVQCINNRAKQFQPNQSNIYVRIAENISILLEQITIYNIKQNIDYSTGQARTLLMIEPQTIINLSPESKEKNEVRKNYQKAITLNPNNEKAHFLLGQYYLKKKTDDIHVTYESKAIEQFLEVLRINSKNKWACYNIARASQNIGSFQKAIQYYKKALQIDPNFDETKTNLGLCYFTQQNYVQSIKCLYEAYNMPNKKDKLHNLLLPIKNAPEPQFKKGITENITNASDLTTIGEMLKAQFLSRAEFCFERIIELEPENSQALLEVARLQSKILRNSDAIATFALFLSKCSGESLPCAELARQYYNSKQYQKGRQCLIKAMKMDDICSDTCEILAQVVEKHSQVYEIACTSKPQNRQNIFQWIAQYFLKEKKQKEAIFFYQELLKLNRNNTDVFKTLINLYQEEGQTTRAFGQIARMLQENVDVQTRMFCVKYLLENNRIEESYRACLVAIKIDITNDSSYKTLTDIIVEYKKNDQSPLLKFQTAQEYYRMAKCLLSYKYQALPTSAQHLIDLLQKSKSQDDKKRIFSRQNTNEESPTAFETENKLKEYIKHLSLQCCEQGLTKLPNISEEYFNFGQLFKQHGEINKAFNCFRRTVKANPKHAKAYAYIAQILQKVQKTQ